MKSVMTLHIISAYLLLIIADAAAKESQIKLEDIERDNLAAERSAKQHPQQHLSSGNYESKMPSLAQHITPPKMQYGFQPLKSSPNYSPPSNIPPVFHYNPSHTQAYFLSSARHQDAHQPQYNYQQAPQVTEPQEVTHAQPPQPGETSLYTQVHYQPSEHKQTHQQYASPGSQIQYVASDQLQPYQYDHHHGAQIQYVVDNSIQQQHGHSTHKYFPQQFYYVQTPSASSNIHSVADTKGNVQYVMYIQAGHPQAGNNVLEYAQDSPFVYQASGESAGSAEFVEDVRPRLVQQLTAIHPRPVFKQQPTSLLDSYVPSILQYQYYKQQQQLEHPNVIKQQPLKLSSAANVGKGDFVKSRGGSTYADRIKY